MLKGHVVYIDHFVMWWPTLVSDSS
jgi:hypothetical protein